MRIYVDTTSEDAAHRDEWDNLLNAIAPYGRSATLVDRRSAADVVLRVRVPQVTAGVSSLRVPEPGVAVWDHGDHPTGLYPGLHCSLPDRRAGSVGRYNPRRHRAAPYPLAYNERIVRFDPPDAVHDVVFHGGLTHRVRRRVVTALAGRPNAKTTVRSGPWASMFDRSGSEPKLDYAQSLRRTRFFVCPRGLGVGSVRLFETMKAGRVPIVVADGYVPPEGPDWSTCALFVPEANVDSILALVAVHRDEWETMAAAARDAWEAHFGEAALLDTIARALRAVDLSGPGPSAWAHAGAAVARNAAMRAYLRVRATGR